MTTTIPPGGRVSDSDSTRFDPYYTIFRAPVDGAQPEFVLFRPFVPFSRNDERKQLQAFMTASSDPATYGKLTAYVIPEPLPDGPLTVASNINQRFSRELTLIDQAGSEVRFGDLQIIPTGGGLIYVRPWFVQAVSSPIPVLDSISVTYSGRSEVGKSLSEALGKLFGVDVDIGDREADTSADTDGDTGTAEPGTDPGTTPVSVEELLADADRLFNEAQEAKLAFDSKTYEEKIEQAYERLRQAAELATGGDVTIESTAPTTTVAPTGVDRRHLSRGAGSSRAGSSRTRLRWSTPGAAPFVGERGQLLVECLGEASLLVGDADLVLAQFVESLLGDLDGCRRLRRRPGRSPLRRAGRSPGRSPGAGWSSPG